MAMAMTMTMRLPPVPPPVPYFRDPTDLPGPLPTAEEISDGLSKSDMSLRRSIQGSEGGVCVVRDMFVVKAGHMVTENEGSTLLFLEQQCPGIPSPRLYAMYRKESSGQLCLVMEYLPGVDLRSLWTSLSLDSKSSIASQLRSMIAQMRALTPPDRFIGGVCGGPLHDPLFSTVKPDRTVNGPFEADDQVGLALATASKRNWENSDHHSWLTDYFLRHLPVALRGHRVTFTHADLNSRNILVEKVPLETGLEREAETTGLSLSGPYRITGIVDWESAGWYPAYWEYASMVGRFHWDSDWLETVDAVMDPYPLEAAMFLLIMRDLGFA